MNRTTEFVLGLIGGIFGIIGGLCALVIGGIDQIVNGSSAIPTASIMAILVSILGIVGAILTRDKDKIKLAGIFLTIAAVVGFICIFALYILPGILLIIAGIMCLLKKEHQEE